MFRFRHLAFAILFVAAGCGTRAESTTPAAEHDDFGTPITFGAAPRRIVSLNPTTTEILVALGAKPRLVGRSQFDVLPESVTSVPSLGLALRPNVEAILAVHPDLVLLYASQDNRPAYDRLHGVGIKVLAFKIDSIAQFQRDTRVLGRLTGDSAAAAQLVDTVTATLDRVRAATASLPHPTVLYPTWEKPLMVIGGGSFLSQLFEIAGAKNVYASVGTPSAAVTMEDVVQRNPDVVISGLKGATKIRENPMWRVVPAVRANHIVEIDETIVAPSVQLGRIAVALANQLHPGLGLK